MEIERLITFKRAVMADAAEITNIKKEAFNKEINTYLGRNGGPPGYDKVESEQDIIKRFLAYKIMKDDKIIGAFFLIQKQSDVMQFEDFVITPLEQGKGYGYLTLCKVEKMYPQIKYWKLSTPVFSIGNQHLYEKFGYKEELRNADEIFYCKEIKGEEAMENYIQGNKEAWEEAFDNKSEHWGADISDRVPNEAYAFFNADTVKTLKKYDLSGKNIGQFCCNNGRELLSLVKTTNAKSGTGFDIAENMIEFANEKAIELNVPCKFVAQNILDIGDEYKEQFDAVIITIGALCWFQNLKDYFAVVSKCMKKGGVIIINEAHPFTNMLAQDGDEGYQPEFPYNFVFSYFKHTWVGNDGMDYITGKDYPSKTFTDYTHSLSEILGAMCENGIYITDMQEFDYDIGGGFDDMNGKEFPLSMIVTGMKRDFC